MKNYCIWNYQFQDILTNEQNVGENNPLCEVVYDFRLQHAQAHYLVGVADWV
jgi:hypothetical protein